MKIAAATICLTGTGTVRMAAAALQRTAAELEPARGTLAEIA